MDLDPYEARAVRLVLENPGMTRHALAEALPAGIATSTAIAKSLVGKGALEEAGVAPSTGGRRAACLSIRSSWGHLFSHQALDGRLHSCVTDAAGKILAKVDRPIRDVKTLFRGVDAAEMELSVKVADGPTLGSAIVVSGTVDRCANRGVASWVHDGEAVDPAANGSHSLVISSAGCHTAWLEMGLATKFNGPWVSIDMAEGLSGLLLTKRCEAVPLDLACLSPDDSLILRHIWEQKTMQRLSRSGAATAKLLANGGELTTALATASADGATDATRVIDEVVDQTCEFVNRAACVLNPKRLLLCANVLDEKLAAHDLIRVALHRRGGFPLDGIHLICPGPAVGVRFSGAALAALNITLSSLEKKNTKR
jgi:hypothetical protein